MMSHDESMCLERSPTVVAREVVRKSVQALYGLDNISWSYRFLVKLVSPKETLTEAMIDSKGVDTSNVAIKICRSNGSTATKADHDVVSSVDHYVEQVVYSILPHGLL